jgi:hypothetical protein
MNCRTIRIAMLLLLCAALVDAQSTSDRSQADRISGRMFPSVFQAWNAAEGFKGEDQWTTLARHDLVFHAPDFFGLKWEGEFQGLSTAFTKDGQESARRTRKLLLGKNSNLIVLAELRYRDAHRSYLPEKPRMLEAEGWQTRSRLGRRRLFTVELLQSCLPLTGCPASQSRDGFRRV